ncbi:hypothetical protein GW17_00001227 [Ensete ventricosum]|nr:hypothetical protein GW17_00001227 [Ensete ventricosum]
MLSSLPSLAAGQFPQEIQILVTPNKDPAFCPLVFLLRHPFELPDPLHKDTSLLEPHNNELNNALEATDVGSGGLCNGTGGRQIGAAIEGGCCSRCVLGFTRIGTSLSLSRLRVSTGEVMGWRPYGAIAVETPEGEAIVTDEG